MSKTFKVKPRIDLETLVLCLVLLSWSASISSQTFNVRSLLPAGATLAQVSEGSRETQWGKRVANSKDAIFEDPWGHTKQWVVFFYLGDRSLIRLYQENPTTHQLEVRWENSGLGAEFDPMSGVWDINGDGQKAIVAFRWIGASVGGTLDIFEWQGKLLKQINPHWNVDVNRAQVADLDKDGRLEIILGHRFDLPSIYEWQTGAYHEANQKFSWYFKKDTEENARLAESGDQHFGAQDLADFCQKAVHGYVYQRRAGEAVALVQEVLKNPKLEGNAILLSNLFVQLGDAYSAEGKLDQAKDSYRKAVKLFPSSIAQKKLLELNPHPLK